MHDGAARATRMRRIALAGRADRHAWISDDRVYACIHGDSGGVTQIGYHGRQPVSRNSLLFDAARGVLTFQWRRGGAWQPLPVEQVLWEPSRCLLPLPSADDCGIAIETAGRALRLRINGTAPEGELGIHIDDESINRNVQGERSWSVTAYAGHGVIFVIQDRILFHDWIRRVGPYAGDFLIPEDVRADVFARPLRSGTGTVDDLRPEFRDADFPLYDATVSCRIHSTHATPERDDGGWRWIFPLAALPPDAPLLEWLFDEERDPAPHIDDTTHPHRAAAAAPRATAAPSLDLPGHPAVMDFFRDTPGIVDSCWVRDIGMPRATPGAYYWIWAWDAMVTSLLFPLWGWIDRSGAVLDFLLAHRCADGSIPMRWTRDLRPLDAPGHGAMDFLFAELLRRHAAACASSDLPARALPSLRETLGDLRARVDHEGLFASLGFYPDLPLRYGRTADSAVTMELAAATAFCRLFEAMAGTAALHDERRAAQALAQRMQSALHRDLGDDNGYFCDAIDRATRERNRSYPLFSLLFLASPSGRDILGTRAASTSQFLARQHLTDRGLRLVPAWDERRTAESVTDAWYPYWDSLAVRLWRETGNAAAILRWLGAVETTLRHIGYCPEFLSLADGTAHDPARWTRHGAPSNCNGMAGWYTALLEGIVGLDTSAAQPVVLPLSLPLGAVRVQGLCFGAARWDVTVRNDGPAFHGLLVDGTHRIDGLAVPVEQFPGPHHHLEILYQ
jgi:hypothetical protein